MKTKQRKLLGSSCVCEWD